MNSLDIAKHLIAKQSVTPEDGGCQDFIADFLTQLRFKITQLPFAKVKNLWAVYGDAGPLFVFAGHTDVVPPGPLDQWDSPPFEPTVRNENLYGRGAADMKSSIAAMMVAAENFINKHPNFNGRIGFLITSDEEGPADNGTKKVVAYLQQQHIIIDYCIVGEASSENKFGDTIKIGRRGSLSGKLKIQGKQGHIAYPHLADNPIHKAANFLSEVSEKRWDEGNDLFQPTQFQISNLHAGTGANNVIPAQLVIDFNFRYSPEVSQEFLQNKIYALLAKHKLEYELNWHHSGNPFYSNPGNFTNIITQVLKNNIGIKPKLSTGGGTSDGRFLIAICKELIELGPINESIHKINEHVNINDLNALETCYEAILQRLFA